VCKVYVCVYTSRELLDFCHTHMIQVRGSCHTHMSATHDTLKSMADWHAYIRMFTQLHTYTHRRTHRHRHKHTDTGVHTGTHTLK